MSPGAKVPVSRARSRANRVGLVAYGRRVRGRAAGAARRLDAPPRPGPGAATVWHARRRRRSVLAAGIGVMAAAMLELWLRGGGLPMARTRQPCAVSSGLYGLLRDRIYVGAVIACLGYAIMRQSGAGIWVVTPCWRWRGVIVLGYERRATEAASGLCRRCVLPPPRRRGSANAVGAGLGVCRRAVPVGHDLRGPEPGRVAPDTRSSYGVERRRSGRAVDRRDRTRSPTCTSGARRRWRAASRPCAASSARPVGDPQRSGSSTSSFPLRGAEAVPDGTPWAGLLLSNDRGTSTRRSRHRRRVGVPGKRGVRVSMARRQVGCSRRPPRHRLSCVTTGMHALLDVAAAGAATAILVRGPSDLDGALPRHRSRGGLLAGMAGGPAAPLSDGVFAAAGTAAGIAVAVSLAGTARSVDRGVHVGAEPAPPSGRRPSRAQPRLS